jgi:hypothetical protein
MLITQPGELQMTTHTVKSAIASFVLGLGVATGHAIAADAPTGNAAEGALPPTQWSEPDTDTTPNGKLTFHGPFCNDTLKVGWEHLPAHQFVRVDVTLLILRTWDGSVQLPLPASKKGLGPDFFQAAIAGGPILLNTTFSNQPDAPGFYPESMTQNFPSPVPGDLLKPQTGADEANSLGYNFPWPGPPQLYPEDATYHLHFIVPHDGESLTLKLRGSGLSGLPDESWGVTDVQVKPLSRADLPAPGEGEIADAFATAIDVTSTHQPDAVNTLVAGMDDTVAWIQKSVTPIKIDDSDIKTAITDYAADDTRADARSEADRTLGNAGAPAEIALRDALRTAKGELRARIENALMTIDDKPIPDEDTRRVMLATRVLEVIGTPKALALRQALVGSGN